MSCKVGKLLSNPQALSQPDRALLQQLVTGDGRDHQGRHVTATTLAQALTLEGHDAGPTTVKDHRAGRCACTRSDG